MPTVETTPLADLIMPSRKLFLESSLARQNRDSSVADSLDVYTAECRAPEKPVVFYNVTSKTMVEPIGAMTVAPLSSLLTATRYICRRSRLACKSGASVVRLCSSWNWNWPFDHDAIQTHKCHDGGGY